MFLHFLAFLRDNLFQIVANAINHHHLSFFQYNLTGTHNATFIPPNSIHMHDTIICIPFIPFHNSYGFPKNVTILNVDIPQIVCQCQHFSPMWCVQKSLT